MKNDMKQVIDKTSHLARLSFPDEDLTKFTQKVKAVLNYVEQLNELDTEKIEPMSHAIEVKGKLREDKAVESGTSKEILENAPERDQTFYQVPRVIE
jgi:aspartyl-tRNA(Asn)/glutamyl-tRNA(Gln) amidotransferase subunit C